MKTRVQGLRNWLKTLDSGFRRKDKKWRFPTFYEFINFIGFPVKRNFTHNPLFPFPRTLACLWQALSHHSHVPSSQLFDLEAFRPRAIRHELVDMSQGRGALDRMRCEAELSSLRSSQHSILESNFHNPFILPISKNSHLTHIIWPGLKNIFDIPFPMK